MIQAVSSDPWDLLLRKLRLRTKLNDLDVEAIRALPIRFQDLRARTAIIREGDTVTNCCLLVRGYACRHKTSRSGARQIVSFHNPGDLLDLQHLQFNRADHTIQAVTDATVGFIPMRNMRAVADDYPTLRNAFWRDCLIDALIFRKWVLNVGRRDAKARIAHMLCEFVVRHEAVGLSSPRRFVLPVTQEDIADAVGLTPEQVALILQELTLEGVLERTDATFNVLEWEQMRAVAEFDPKYLHLAA